LADDGYTRRLESDVGHPGERWDTLLAHVTDNGVRQFADVQGEWLSLMWCLDAYRREGVIPRNMGSSKNKGEQLAAIYRGKGNWFAQLLAALLENRTAQRVAPITRVQGFSQIHQIDLAWPDRDEDPLICAETKVTGAPAYGQYPERGAMADFTNRRKELKFAATDLKLFRRDRDTVIEHWGDWRESSPPTTYFLWAARLRRGRLKHYKTKPSRLVSSDDISSLVRESAALVSTYLDGAGLFAWRINDSGSGYEPVRMSTSERVTELDDVLHKIASQINRLARGQGGPPAPVRPLVRAVGDTEGLLDAGDERDY
jgi:hypothetical protein